MRTAKTALCVLICLLIYEFFSLIDLSGFSDSRFLNMIRQCVLEGAPSFACIAAVISLQDTVEETVQMGFSRIIGSVVGGAFAMGFAELDKIYKAGNLYIIYAVLGVVIIICLCNFFNKPDAVSISVITFLIIFTGIDSQRSYYFAFNRITGTLIGVVVAFFVNRYVKPPKKQNKKGGENGKQQ